MEQKGLFIVIDGIDGAGKTTQARLLSQRLIGLGFNTFLTQEPGDNEIGKVLRKFLKDPGVPAAVDALLFAADRVFHCEFDIKPHLRSGDVVISDRYRDSSYVYQSIVLNENDMALPLDWIKEINRYSINPDITIILDLDPEIALKRRLIENKNENVSDDKFERLNVLRLIRERFLEISSDNRPYFRCTSDLSAVNWESLKKNFRLGEDFHFILALNGTESIAEISETIWSIIGGIGLLNSVYSGE